MNSESKKAPDPEYAKLIDEQRTSQQKEWEDQAIRRTEYLRKVLSQVKIDNGAHIITPEKVMLWDAHKDNGTLYDDYDEPAESIATQK